jgi:hypothetical protein
MSTHPQFRRHHEIQKIRGKLERDGFPRLQMSLLVTLTGASGFVASYVLLHAGMGEMWLRYLAAFAVAYLVFLVLLWLWLRTGVEDYVDFPNFLEPLPSGASSPGLSFSGQDGNFGGGGASASFDGAAEPGSALGGADGPVGDALGTVAEADEFAIPLMVVILAAALVFSSLFMIYSAPLLFAELLVDGVLSASLYRRLRGLESRHWLETALRRTALPFALTAVIVSASGWGMARYAPGAHSMGDVIAHSRQGG